MRGPDWPAHWGREINLLGDECMPIATEPIGSIPRPPRLIQATRDLDAGGITASEYDVLLDESIRDTIVRFEATGSPVITDGEQGQPRFAPYPRHAVRR